MQNSIETSAITSFCPIGRQFTVDMVEILYSSVVQRHFSPLFVFELRKILEWEAGILRGKKL
jgi:hypothetical protein